MTESLTVFVACDTAAEKKPHPLLIAPTGLLCMSCKLGSARDDSPALGCKLLLSGAGEGELPKPAYRPPCDGGRSVDREALAFPREAKKSSLAVFCEDAPLLLNGFVARDPPAFIGLADRDEPAI